jgi:hypothetical protein
MKSRYADLLGNLKSEISSVKAEAKVATAQLISLAADHPGRACAIEGELFRACVSWVDQKVVDHNAVYEELSKVVAIDLIERLVKKHTRVAECVPKVRVSAMK